MEITDDGHRMEKKKNCETFRGVTIKIIITEIIHINISLIYLSLNVSIIYIILFYISLNASICFLFCFFISFLYFFRPINN